MKLKEAYKKAKILNKNNHKFTHRVVYRNYKGYDVVSEPFELPVIRASLQTTSSLNRNFAHNYKLKYAR